GILRALADAPPPDTDSDAEDGFAAAGNRYRQRYRRFLAPDALSGWRIGVFEHSSVARDHLCSLLWRAGAEVVRLGRAEGFVGVDREAFSVAPSGRADRSRASTGVRCFGGRAPRWSGSGGRRAS